MGRCPTENETHPPVPSPVGTVATVAFRRGERRAAERVAPEESPVALVYDGSTEAVMMATPADLEDFALGFSLNEGLIERPSDIRQLDIVPGPDGIEARMWLERDRGLAIAARRRTRTGPTGCGLCGIESLAEANRVHSTIDSANGLTLSASQVHAAIAGLEAAQPLGAVTKAVHAAGFWRADGGLIALREDVGRHNALDKLAGALARAGVSASDGAVVLTSRVSVEMVQKTAAMGAPVLIAISAPTGLAIRTADAAGVTIVAVARSDGFEIFTHPERITE